MTLEELQRLRDAYTPNKFRHLSAGERAFATAAHEAMAPGGCIAQLAERDALRLRCDEQDPQFDVLYLKLLAACLDNLDIKTLEKLRDATGDYALIPDDAKLARARARNREEAWQAVIAAIEKSHDPIVLHGGKAERDALKELSDRWDGGEESGAIFHGRYHDLAFAVQLVEKV